MNKIEEAKTILTELKVPTKQQSDICCYTLLSMASLTEDNEWSDAANEWIRIHDVISFIKEHYNIEYAENSRETFRKQAMHHFRNAAFIEDNGKATNSPNYRYRLTDEMVALLRTYGSDKWESGMILFLCAVLRQTMTAQPLNCQEITNYVVVKTVFDMHFSLDNDIICDIMTERL